MPLLQRQTAVDAELDDEAPRRHRTATFVASGLGIAVVSIIVVALTCRSSNRPSISGTAAAGASPARSGIPEAPPAPAPPQMPKRIVVKVERVELATDATAWDGAMPESKYRQVCQVIGGAVSVVSSGAGTGVGAACGLLSNERQQQSDPREPDLRLELRARGVTYTTFVAPDRRAYQYGYDFVVPDEAILPEGIVIAVVDDDDDGSGGAEVGSVRIGRDELIAMAETRELRAFRGGSVQRIELKVEAHDGRLRKQEAEFDIRNGGMVVRGLDVRAGEVVRIETSGEWQIGTSNNQVLGPEGFTDGRLQNYNLGAFPNAAHGSTVALVGREGRRVAIPVAPCVRVVSPYSGPIWVGVNDRKVSDNVGAVHIRAFVRAAKATEWASPGALLGCD